MRNYEVMFIVRPDVVDEDLDKLIETMSGHATTAGATVKNSEKLGKRHLAYSVKGFHDGSYVLLHLESEGPAIHELERRMRVAEPVIKFLTIRMDEEMKKLHKHEAMRAQRAAHAASKLPAEVAAPAPVAVEEVAAPVAAPVVAPVVAPVAEVAAPAPDEVPAPAV